MSTFKTLESLFKKPSLIFILSFFINHFGWTQTYFTAFKKYTVEDGLVSNNTLNLLQDSKGYLWVGTVEGASRFDGKYFTNYGWNDNSLPSKYIYQMIQANDSLILFATTSGMAVFNINSNYFTNDIITDSELKAGSQMKVVSIINIPHKQFLVSLTGSILKLDEHLHVIKKRKVFPVDAMLPTFMYPNHIFTKSDSSQVWIVGNYGDYSQRGLNNVDINNLNLSPPENPFTKPFNLGSDLYNGYTSFLKISDTSGGFFNVFGWGFTYRNPYKGDSVNFYFSKDGGEGNTVRSRILKDPDMDSIYWLGSSTGLIRFNLQTKTYQRFIFTVNGKDFNPNFIHDILFDKDGNLWLATYAGIKKISRMALSFHTITYDNSVFSFAGALRDSHHRFWAYSFGKGVYLWNENLEFVNHFYHTDIMSWWLLHDMIEIADTIYAGTGCGVYYYDERQKDFRPAKFYPDSLSDDGANFFFLDSKNKLWIGARGRGLFVHDLNTRENKFYCRSDSLHTPFYFPLPSASTCAEDSYHNLWFGRSREQSMLVHWERSTGKFSIVDVVVNQQQIKICEIYKLLTDSDDNLWIATWNYGILKYNIRTKQWMQYDRMSGLAGNSVEDMKFDASGNLWTSDANGISVLMKSKNRFRKFTNSEGFPFSEVTFVSFPFPNEKNKIVFGNSDQLLWFDTHDLLRMPSVGNLSIEKILVENIPVSLSGKNEFDYKQSHFNFQFAGVNLLNGEQNQYSYKLEDADKDWIFCGTQHQANYANLNPGKYIFKVRVASTDGKWSAPVEYAFVIAPAFYDTWWFRLLIGLAVGSALYGLYRLRINRILEMERVRSRISRDLHDDIGSTLSSINMLTRSAKKRADEKDETRLKDQLEKISDRTQRMLDNMSDIIWSVKPENDSLDKILSRMREYASTVLEAKKIPFTIDFPENNNDVKLSLELKNNLFLIFKEAINNLAKYSECTEAVISFENTNGKIVLVVKDDGKGFEISQSL